MDNFLSIGTDKLSIGKQLKMGTSSLDTLPFKQYDVLNKNQTAVVLIRDVIDKWKSGYKQELEEYIEDICDDLLERPENLNPNVLRRFWQRFKHGYYTTFTNPDEVTSVGLEILSKLHDYYADLNWIHYRHAAFWGWNNRYFDLHGGVVKESLSLWELSLNPNVYFLDLKDLSNPKFLEWAQKVDDDWKKVIEIPHQNSTLNKFWPQMELLWKEYNEGKILKGKILASPFFEETTLKLKFDVHFKLLEFHQDSVDYIRDNHERYLKFDI